MQSNNAICIYVNTEILVTSVNASSHANFYTVKLCMYKIRQFTFTINIFQVEELYNPLHFYLVDDRWLLCLYLWWPSFFNVSGKNAKPLNACLVPHNNLTQWANAPFTYVILYRFFRHYLFKSSASPKSLISDMQFTEFTIYHGSGHYHGTYYNSNIFNDLVNKKKAYIEPA